MADKIIVKENNVILEVKEISLTRNLNNDYNNLTNKPNLDNFLIANNIIQGNNVVLEKIGNNITINANDNSKISGVAGTSISSHKVVYLDSNNLIQYCSNLDFNKAKKVIGITTTSGNTGEQVMIQNHGKLTDPSFSFTVDNLLFLGDNGLITQTYPSNAQVCIQIGFVINENTIFIDIKEPILII